MSKPSAERLRDHLRRVLPVLRGQGWDEADLQMIGTAIKRALDAGDGGLLRCWTDWMEEKLADEPPARGVVPMLSFEAEARIAERKWAEAQVKQQHRSAK